LAKNGSNMAAGVYDVPIDIDNNVARIALESQGIMLDKLTVEQKNYRQNWKEGT
jgi:adenosylhomocysteinase